MTQSSLGREPFSACFLFRWLMNSRQSSILSVSKLWKLSLPPGSVLWASVVK